MEKLDNLPFTDKPLTEALLKFMCTVTITLFVILLFSTTLHAQVKEYSVSDLLKYMNHHQDNLFETFSDYDRNAKSRHVSDTIIWFAVNDVASAKSAYYNDSLKNILVALFNDTVGWTDYNAELYIKMNRRNTDSSYFVNSILKSYLKTIGVNNTDSVLHTRKLLDSYSDLYWKQRKERFCVEEPCILPSALVDLVSRIHYPELYEVCSNHWLKQCTEADTKVTTGSYYKLLLSYQSPLVTDIDKYFEYSSSDSVPEAIIRPMLSYAAVGNSKESYQLMSRLLDKTYPVCDGPNRIPANLFLLGNSTFGWVYKELDMLYRPHIEEPSFPNPLEDFGDIAWSVNIYMNKNLNRKKEWEGVNPKFGYDELLELSRKYIIPNLDYLRSYINKKCDFFDDPDLYWKKDMPYYKKEDVDK